jgi:hypothetical protein
MSEHAGNILGGGGPCPAPASHSSAALADLSPTSAAFQIIARKAKETKPADFLQWWRDELRTGGELCEYIRREKAQTASRYRAVARKNDGWKQNNKSDIRKVADIPIRDYFRWLKEDPDFFADNKNLRSLKRDNPDVCVYV